jgi:hypothetical protein
MQITNHSRGLEIQRPVLSPVINTLKQNGKNITPSATSQYLHFATRSFFLSLMIIIMNNDYLWTHRAPNVLHKKEQGKVFFTL